MASARMKDSMQEARGLATLPATFNALPDGDIVPWDPHAPPHGEPTGGQTCGAPVRLPLPLLIGSNAHEFSDFARFIGFSMLGRLGRYLASFAIRRRLMMAPEPLLRLAAGRLTRSELPDAEARAACDTLIQRLGGDMESAIDLLATHAEREMARAHCARAPVYEFEIHLTAEESPIIGSGHGVDFALLFQPRAPGTHGPIFTAEEKAGACRAFFGRDALGEEVQAVADELRTAIVRFATTGSPRHFGSVPWRAAHGAEGDGGQMIVSTTPRFEEWGSKDSGGRRRQVVREVLQELRNGR